MVAARRAWTVAAAALMASVPGAAAPDAGAGRAVGPVAVTDIVELAVAPGDPARWALVTGEGAVWWTDDSGASWRRALGPTAGALGPAADAETVRGAVAARVQDAVDALDTDDPGLVDDEEIEEALDARDEAADAVVTRTEAVLAAPMASVDAPVGRPCLTWTAVDRLEVRRDDGGWVVSPSDAPRPAPALAGGCSTHGDAREGPLRVEVGPSVLRVTPQGVTREDGAVPGAVVRDLRREDDGVAPTPVVRRGSPLATAVARRALAWLAPQASVELRWLGQGAVGSARDAGFATSRGGDVQVVGQLTWRPPASLGRAGDAGAVAVRRDADGVRVYGRDEATVLAARLRREAVEVEAARLRRLAGLLAERVDVDGVLAEPSTASLRERVLLRLRRDEIDAWIDALTGAPSAGSAPAAGRALASPR